MQVLQDFEKTYITTANTYQIFTGVGTLHAITVNTTANGTISVIDNTTGNTVNLALLKASVAEQTFVFNCAIKTGLRIITANNSDITVTWKKG